MSIAHAIMLAEQYHDGQRYGEHPYQYHLLDVVRCVQSRGGSLEHQIVAWLHDIVEDSLMSCTMLEELGFTHDVVLAVKYITKWEGQSYDDYIEAVLYNSLALEVKKCDTMCNLNQSFIDKNRRRTSKYTRQLILLME